MPPVWVPVGTSPEGNLDFLEGTWNPRDGIPCYLVDPCCYHFRNHMDPENILKTRAYSSGFERPNLEKGLESPCGP